MDEGDGRMKYRAKPVEVDAVEWLDTDESWAAVCALVGDGEDVFFRNADGTIAIETLTARARAIPNDWIVKFMGEIYPVPGPVFVERYAVAE
jgi:hypothetical protein